MVRDKHFANDDQLCKCNVETSVHVIKWKLNEKIQTINKD